MRLSLLQRVASKKNSCVLPIPFVYAFLIALHTRTQQQFTVKETEMCGGGDNSGAQNIVDTQKNAPHLRRVPLPARSTITCPPQPSPDKN